MQLVIYPNKPIPLWIKKQLLELYNRFFPRKPTQPQRTLRWVDATQFNRVRFILFEGHTVISHAAVLTRQLVHAGKIYKLAGLGGILTHPKFQNKRFGSKIVKSATNYIDSQNFDVAVLFCHRKHEAFYRRNGWQILSNETIKIGKNKLSAQPQDEITLIRYLTNKAFINRKDFENKPIFILYPCF